MSVKGLNKKMKNKINVFIMVYIMFVSISLVGCEKNTDKDSEQEDIITYDVDLTHDETPESLIVDLSDIRADNQQPAKLMVKNKDSKVIWEEDLFLPSAGWGSYYLYEVDGLPYLLYYFPSNSQGFGNYSYQCFSLDEEGKEIILVSDEISFDTYPNTKDINFPIDKMIAFATNVNAYLDNSFLLISTFEGKIKYSTDDNRIKNHETYESLERDNPGLKSADLDLKEYLEKYRTYLDEIWIKRQNN